MSTDTGRELQRDHSGRLRHLLTLEGLSADELEQLLDLAQFYVRTPGDMPPRDQSLLSFARTLGLGLVIVVLATHIPFVGVPTWSVAILLGLGVLFAWRRSHSGTAAGGKVIAVLPFENLGDTASDYFADGIADALPMCSED